MGGLVFGPGEVAGPGIARRQIPHGQGVGVALFGDFLHLGGIVSNLGGYWDLIDVALRVEGIGDVEVSEGFVLQLDVGAEQLGALHVHIRNRHHQKAIVAVDVAVPLVAV